MGTAAILLRITSCPVIAVGEPNNARVGWSARLPGGTVSRVLLNDGGVAQHLLCHLPWGTPVRAGWCALARVGCDTTLVRYKHVALHRAARAGAQEVRVGGVMFSTYS